MFRDHEHSRPDVVFAAMIGLIVDIIGDLMFSSSLRSEEALRLAWWALRVTIFTFTAIMASIAGLEAIAVGANQRIIMLYFSSVLCTLWWAPWCYCLISQTID
jgi:hypothetical protein